MPFLIGTCCTDTIIPAPPGSGASSPNEIVPFTNVPQITILWNAERIAKFGEAPVFQVEMLGGDGVYRVTPVEVVPDNITATTKYTFNFGGASSGRVVIS